MKITIDTQKKKKAEYSKKILTFGWSVFLVVIIFTLLMVYLTKDLTPLETIITILGGTVAVGEGFYYNKAKAENKIKLMKENEIPITGEHFKEEQQREYIDLTALVTALIGVIAAIAARYAIPYLKEKWGEAKFNNVAKWVEIAVGAAEMIYKESGMGQQKKAYVIQFLNKKGFSVDYDTIDNLIENAVLELNAEK